MIITQRLELKGVVKYVYKKMGKAILDYKMLEDNDRLLVLAFSCEGLLLAKLFQMRERRIPLNFYFFIGIRKMANQMEIEDNFPLPSERIVEIELSSQEEDDLWCDRNSRNYIFEVARRFNCNKIALPHTLEDMAEVMLSNILFYGKVKPLQPRIVLDRLNITVIRPLCYVERKELNQFALRVGLPYRVNFPSGDWRRQMVREILKDLERECPFVKKNIFRSIKRIKKDYLL